MTKRYWLILVTYILVQLSGFFGVPLVMSFGVDMIASIALWSLISFLIGLIIILVLLGRERNERDIGFERKASAGQSIKWAILGVFLAFIAQYIAIFIETSLFGIDPNSENTEEILDMVRLIPTFAIIVAILGPILEEIVFRKVIFGALYRRFSFFISALLSSLFFSVVHFDLPHILVYTAVGFTFSYLYVKTGRIIVPIVAHVSMNAYAVIIQVLLGDRIEEMQRELEQMQSIIGGLWI